MPDCLHRSAAACRLVAAGVAALVFFLLMTFPVAAAPTPELAGTTLPGTPGHVISFSSPASPAPAEDFGWDPARAQQAILDAPIAALPGAPARYNEQQIAAAIAGTNIRILALPFEVRDQDLRRASGQAQVELRQWAEREHDIELITVTGLEGNVGIFNVAPDSFDEAAYVLAHFDPTEQLLYAITYLKEGKEAADQAPAGPVIERRAADSAVVEDVAAVMATGEVYIHPDLDLPPYDQPWQIDDTTVLRAAFLPPIPAGQPVPDLLSALTQHFPGDIVMVSFGRFFEAAGSAADEAEIAAAVRYVYGRFAAPLAAWELDISVMGQLVADRLSDVRSGTVSDQEAPAVPSSPIQQASSALPYIFTGVAAVLLFAGIIISGRRRRALVRASDRASGQELTALRRAQTTELVHLAADMVALDGLARTGGPRTAVNVASERYRIAQETLQRDGAIDVISQALAGARTALDDAAAQLNIALPSQTQAQLAPDEEQTS